MRVATAVVKKALSVTLAGVFLLSSTVGVAAFSKKFTGPFSFPVDPSPDIEIENAVRRAFLGRGWRVLKHAPRDLQARYVSREKNSITIEATWTDTQVSFTYVDSSNMDYNAVDGAQKINGTYFRWLEYLKHDTVIFLARGSGEPLPDWDDPSPSEKPPAATASPASAPAAPSSGT